MSEVGTPLASFCPHLHQHIDSGPFCVREAELNISFISCHNQPNCLQMHFPLWSKSSWRQILFMAVNSSASNHLLHWHKQDLLTLAQQEIEESFQNMSFSATGKCGARSLKSHHFVIGPWIIPKCTLSWEPGVQSKIAAFISITLRVNKTHLHTLFHLILTIILWGQQDKNYYCYFSD